MTAPAPKGEPAVDRPYREKHAPPPGWRCKNVHLEFARLIAGAPRPTEDDVGALCARLAKEQSELDLFRGAFLAAAEAICGSDPTWWGCLLVEIVSFHPREFIEAGDGHK